MRELSYPLFTPRLRLEPITRALGEAASGGPDGLASALGADVPREWAPGGMRLLSAARRNSWTNAAPTRAIVIHEGDERVIGDIRFEPVALAPDTIELGYGILAAYRQQGYAVEASTRILSWLFDEARVTRVIAGCDMRNRASVRTLRRLGFWLDSAKRGRAFWWTLDHELYALRAKEARNGA